MPAEIVYDIFALRGVAPKWKPQIDWANEMLKKNHPGTKVKVKLGKIQWFWHRDGKGNMKEPAMGAQTPGTNDPKKYRYSQDQKDLLNHKMISDKKVGVRPGHVCVIWATKFSTGELGEAVNPAVWDETYAGRSGIFMSNDSKSDKSCLLHETGHLAGLHHDNSDPNELMHSTNPDLTTISEDNKKALANAVF